VERNDIAPVRLSVLLAVMSGISGLSTAQTPEAMYGEMQSTLEAAQEKMAALNSASSRIATQSALTVFSSIVPGGAWAGHAIGAAQAQAQQMEAARNIQQTMQQARELMAIMPQMLRGQRVIELAQMRNCAWLRE
jgi:hypothetical protein